ncbi:sulfurtransferase TusA family protein [Geomesophilobacter sediminis]|uniref:Sulfurtransferase TusA family protein n=1 Tax=Geomesophilobacter sediminis TaxID=2798584 RepID=A0A8J7JMA4_9BACT|nr:sulfurtransferase TusA family protein [Geomesophilobacter sediminis]MBJ6725805.1 sulfurtransferase TusA family protein [Geomesophilobacter sediminis]
MKVRVLEATGIKCPQPIMKLTVISPQLKPGEILEIVGDCPTFESDVRAWCSRLKKTLLFVQQEAGYRKRIRIRF